MVPVTELNANNYIFEKIIGEGSYSTVYLANDVLTDFYYAIKVYEKRQIIRKKKHELVSREKDVLKILNLSESSFFIKLYCTFQDAYRLYFVTSYAKNGDLLQHINRVGVWNVACTRFYSGEILCALEYLHDLNIIHLDLKPENILLDYNMHIKVADFGCSKIIESYDVNLSGIHRSSFVGTAQYVSPELLTVKMISYSSDIWALGCIIYQMTAGFPPFESRSEYLLYKKIVNLQYVYPNKFNTDVKDIVQKLLVLDPNERIGTYDVKRYTSIRSHPFYQDLDFDTLYLTKPPLQACHYPSNDSGSQEIHDHYPAPDNLKPGLDDTQLIRLLDLENQNNLMTAIPGSPRKRSNDILQMNNDEKQQKLQEQKYNSKWHRLVEGNLIIKQGLVVTRKWIFTKRRMLILTTGPHLYYVNPVTMTLKEEIPWSSQLRVEAKNFKIFVVYTPNRTYCLEDPEGFALKWCKTIEEMKANTRGDSTMAHV